MAMKIGNITLPDIPVEVKSKYRYLLISENDIDMNSDDNVIVYTLHGSNTPMVYVSSDVSKKMGNAIITNEPTSCYYSFQQGLTSWKLDSTHSTNKVISITGVFLNYAKYTPIWSNHNIYTATYYSDQKNDGSFDSLAFDSESMKFTVGNEVYFTKSIKFDGAWHPGIPVDVLETYPYVVVQKVTYSSGECGYTFRAANSPYIYVGRDIIDGSIDNIVLQAMGDENTTALVSPSSSKNTNYIYAEDTNTWDKLIDSTVMTPIPIGNTIGDSGENLGYYELVWANHDIYEAVSYNNNTKEHTIGEEIYFESSYLIKSSDIHYKAIASKVREILGEETQYKPRELPDAIRSTSDALQFPYNITTGVEYRKGSTNVVGGILYPGLYTPDDVEIILPNNITEIANYGFKYLSFYIQKLVCNEGLTKIGDWALFSAYALTELKLPKSLISIGERAFYSASKLTELELPENLENIGVSAFYNGKITNLVIPKNVKTIGMSAFEHCESLTDVVILSEQLDELYGTFGYCNSLKRVDIKGNVSRLYGQTFYNCMALETVIIRGDFCSLPYISPFQNSSISAKTGYIYVPAALLDKYKTTKTWSTYASQIRAIEDYPEICDPTT